MKRKNKMIWGLLLCFLFFPLVTFHQKYNIVINDTSLVSLQAEKNVSQTTLKNLAIFVKFQDSNALHSITDSLCIENANKIYNSDYFEMDTVKGKMMVPSFKTYYEKQSYGKMSIHTELLPQENGAVISYVDSHPIEYYLKYNSENTLGYKNNTEKEARETELINHAVAFVESKIKNSNIASSEIDTDQNGFIDAISFIIEGERDLPSAIVWGDLLWSHKSEKTGIHNTILGKRIKVYNLLYADDYTESATLFSLNRGTYGTIIHEFGHTLGFLDLYSYSNPNQKPVGFYDIMGNTIGSNPQNFLTYFLSESNDKIQWHDKVEEINKTTRNITLQKPNFVDPNEKRAIKLKVNGYDDEFFFVEYHEKQKTYDSYSADASGIIVYRVKGNHVYVFRPGETVLGEGKGNLSMASLNLLRPSLGKALDVNQDSFDNDTIHFADGTNTGIQIKVVGETSTSVTFDVIYPEYVGTGSKEDPYLIGDVETFLKLMKANTTNQYYKLTHSLDFSSVNNYPMLNFEGNLDGNFKTISNVKTNGSGLFHSVGNFATSTIIQNLKLEKIQVFSNKKDYLGGFSDTADHVTLKNIHILSGSVKNDGVSMNSLVSTGGFLGNASSTTKIEDCSSNVHVTAEKNVGGFLGINLNASLKNCFASGTVNGNANKGGFLGLQAILETTYKVPQNVFYKKDSSILQGVGGYASSFHNLNVLKENELSKGIVGISNVPAIELLKDEKLALSLETTPKTTVTSKVSVVNETIVTYENNTFIAKNVGSTKVYVDIVIGLGKMRLTVDVKVNPKEEKVREEDVLKKLGLVKKDQYILGISLNTDIASFRKKIMNLNGVTLKSFRSASNVEEQTGIIKTGMKFTLVFPQTEYNYTVVIKGDVNGDGLIYATDYVKVKNHIMGKSKLTGAYLLAADIDGDGNVYATDYVKIKNHIMGKNLIK